MKNLVCFHEALASEHRLRILNLIHKAELSVGHLQAVMQADQQSKISRHLAYLRKAKLVRTRRNGKFVYYKLGEIHNQLKTILEKSLEYLSDKPEIKSDKKRLEKAMS